MDTAAARRAEELVVLVHKLDAQISELHDEAFRFAHGDKFGERRGRYAFFYHRNGKELIAALDGAIEELRKIDPECSIRIVWADLLESKALYHWNFAAQLHQMEKEYDKLLEKVSSPFASSDTQEDFAAALAAYEKTAELAPTVTKLKLNVGEARWRLRDRAGAIEALNDFVATSDDAERRLEARALLDEIEKFDDAAIARIGQSTSPSACIIASACVGADAPRVAALRSARDRAMTEDPVARDFFHVFFSRYYEWSPPVARLAEAHPEVRSHLRWGFLDPWLSWMDFVAATGRRGVDELSAAEKDALLERLVAGRDAWLSELPARMESKCPQDPGEVFAAFERFRRIVAGS